MTQGSSAGHKIACGVEQKLCAATLSGQKEGSKQHRNSSSQTYKHHGGLAANALALVMCGSLLHQGRLRRKRTWRWIMQLIKRLGQRLNVSNMF